MKERAPWVRTTCVVLLAAATACSEPCEKRSIGECEEDDSCSVLSGRPVDEQNMCLGEHAKAACSERVELCGAAITLAQDSAGKVWWFSNTCIPDGWKSAQDSAASLWTSCDEN